jgi:hypothetical protein
MYSIGKVQEVKAPRQAEVSWERREFRSPDHLWLAAFHSPYEWHMGAVGWQFTLESASDGAAVCHTALQKMSEGEGLRCPVDYVPWRADSMMLALLPWKKKLVLFDTRLMRRRKTDLDESPYGVQWASHGERLLASFRDRLALLDGAGNLVANADWKTSEHESPHIGWLPSGKVFFAIGRTSRRAKPRIGFFRGEDGSAIAKQMLDPNRLVPYEVEQYKSIPRGRYSLIASPSSLSVGYSLDIWDDVIYDQEKGLLFLSTYRPVSPPFESDASPVCQAFKLDGYPVCQVEERWVSVELSG